MSSNTSAPLNLSMSTVYPGHTPTFGIVTSFTLNNPFLESRTANLGLLYGFKGISMYSFMHGYYFLPIFMPPPHEEHNWNRVRLTLQLFQHKKQREVSCLYNWVVWMESDQFITNYDITLASIVEQAVVQSGKVPDIIVNRDVVGNINTGIMFIRCSEMGRKAMVRIRELQITHAHNRLVDQWDSNGCIMLLHKEIEFREVMVFLPPKVFNSYVYFDAEKKVAACPAHECAKGYWSPGDFLVHFAGRKQDIEPFLQAFPASSWLGYQTHYAVPLERMCGLP